MESRIGVGKRHPSVPDAELLRLIAHDMRSLYAEVIRQPLPRNIEIALSRIEREQSRAMCQGQRLGAKACLMAYSNTGQKRDCQENRPDKYRSAGPCNPSWTVVEVDGLGNCHPLYPMAKEYCGLMAI